MAKKKKYTVYQYQQAEKEAEFWTHPQTIENNQPIHKNLYGSVSTGYASFTNTIAPELLLEFEPLDIERYGNGKHIERNLILKGSTYMGPGYIYAPYIPIFITPCVLINEPDFKSKKKPSRRYAKKKINSKYYGEIKFSSQIHVRLDNTNSTHTKRNYSKRNYFRI